MTERSDRSAGRGRNRREWYLPEPVYIDGTSDVGLSREQLIEAARITAGVAAQDATQFEAILSAEVRAGSLPKRRGERKTMVENFFDWLSESYRRSEQGSFTKLQLSRGRSLVLEIERD